MRTQKRFTQALLARYAQEGRGTGTYEDYIPWHRVGRSDPSSIGRSHLTNWQGRQIETLSDKEWEGFHFSLLLKDLADIREQFPLQLRECPHEQGDYAVRYDGKTYAGTLEIAKNIDIRHPLVQGEGNSQPWRMTTDQLVTLNNRGKIELLAVAYKPDVTALTKRKKQLLAIEREYWRIRGVQWLLITPAEYEQSVALTLRRAAPWGLAKPVPAASIKTAVDIAHRNCNRSLATVVDLIEDSLGDDFTALYCFWQAVFRGDLLLDLRRGWRPHVPISLVSQEQFDSFNPLAARRTAWN